MTNETRRRQWRQLAITVIVIGILWLVALPIVGVQPSVSEHVAAQKRLGIDPSAMFYTELEISPMIARHVEGLHDAHSASFWQTSTKDVHRRSAQE